MNLYIVAAGKVKEAWLRDGIQEYQKRLRPYVDLEIIEVQDAADSDNPDKERQEESDRMWARVEKNPALARSYKIALDLHGKSFNSEDMAAMFEKAFDLGGASVSLFIAGSLGYGENFLNKMDMRLSLGPSTFPHQLCRLLLLEQVYRSFKIMRNEKYHK